MRKLILAVAVLAVLAAASGASAHGPRYACSTSINFTGWCANFNGVTTNDWQGRNVVDPVNIVWWPYGGWRVTVTGGELQYILTYQYGWRETCGSTQWNYRDGSHKPQDGSAGSSWCPNSRWHVRVFQGHAHQSCCNPGKSSPYDYSVSDAHHESFPFHDIDMNWDRAESLVAGIARAHGHPTTPFWLYLPRANRTFQGFYSDGWATQVNSHAW